MSNMPSTFDKNDFFFQVLGFNYKKNSTLRVYIDAIKRWRLIWLLSLIKKVGEVLIYSPHFEKVLDMDHVELPCFKSPSLTLTDVFLLME